MAEKLIEVGINKGLWYNFGDNQNDLVPDGYCAQSSNMVKVLSGNLAPRGSFFCNSGAAWTDFGSYVDNHYNVIDAAPVEDLCHSARAFELSNGSDAPVIIISWADAGTKYFKMVSGWATAGKNAWGKGTIAGRKAWTAMCQYKDRIYGSDNVTPVGKLTNFGNFDGTVGTVTVTDMGLPVANNSDKITCLVSLNDRIFASAGNRIWFTEVAAAGGYPENWNSGNNFLDIIAERGTSIIAKMIPMNDRLYIFTDKGIYVLNCKGTASTWVLQLITSDVSIFSPNGVQRIGHVFILTDRASFFTFNGSTLKKILPQMEYLNQQWNTIELFPFEDGVLIQYCSATPLVPAGTYTTGTPFVYYFDGEVVSQFQFPFGIISNSSQFICGSFTKKYTALDQSQPRSYVITMRGPFQYRANDYAGDLDASNVKQDYNWSLTTKFVRLPFRAVKWLNTYIRLFHYDLVTSATSTTSSSFNGTTYSSGSTSILGATGTGGSYDGYTFKRSCENTGNKMKVLIQGIVKANEISSAFPTVEIQEVALSYEDQSDNEIFYGINRV